MLGNTLLGTWVPGPKSSKRVALNPQKEQTRQIMVLLCFQGSGLRSCFVVFSCFLCRAKVAFVFSCLGCKAGAGNHLQRKMEAPIVTAVRSQNRLFHARGIMRGERSKLQAGERRKHRQRPKKEEHVRMSTSS